MHPRLSILLCRSIQAARRNPFFAQLAALERTQWWSEEALRELQLERLRGLLAHAAERIPYYRELFRTLGFDVRSLRSLADLAALPVLTREQVRAEGGRLVDERLRGRPYSEQSTSGSTGTPLRIVADRSASAAARTPKYRGLRWHGLAYGAPQAWVWRRSSRSRLARLAHWTENQLVWPCHGDVQEDGARAFYARCRRFSPQILFGNPSALVRLAHVFEAAGLDGRRLSLRLVLCSGELLLEAQAALLRRAFGARVVAEYGCTEFGVVAFPCERGSAHWSAEHVILETGEARDATGSRPLVLTGLMNRAMPLVRYDLGDEVALGHRPCPCGRSLPVLERVVGRSRASLRLAGGGRVSPVEIAALAERVLASPGVLHVRLVQDALDAVAIEVATDRGRPVPRAEDTLRTELARLSGGRLRVGVAWKRDVAPEATGKRSIVLSRLEAGDLQRSSER